VNSRNTETILHCQTGTALNNDLFHCVSYLYPTFFGFQLQLSIFFSKQHDGYTYYIHAPTQIHNPYTWLALTKWPPRGANRESNNDCSVIAAVIVILQTLCQQKLFFSHWMSE